MGRDYVKDSTRGNAKIIPLNYKGDVLVQSWIDARKLATLSKWLDEGGYFTRFLSDIVKIVIDEVVGQLVEGGKCEMVEFSEDARDYLVSKYRVNLNPSNRGKRNMLHNLHLDEMRRKSMNDIDILPNGRGNCEDSREWVENAINVYKELEIKEKEKEEFKLNEELKENIKRAKDSGKIVKDRDNRLKKKIRADNAYKPKSEEEIMNDVRKRDEEDRKLADMDMSSEALGLKS